MKKRKTNPKVQNTLLLIACIVLFLILGSLLFFNHKKEAANSSELKKAAQEEIQKEKSDQTWTENQNSEDQNNASQTEAVCAHVVCKKERGANYEVYNDKAVGLMAVMAILLCLSGLIWYQYAVLRYGIIIAGCAVGAVLGYRVIKMRKVKQ